MLLAVNLFIRSGDHEMAGLVESVVMQLANLQPEIRVHFFSSRPDPGTSIAPNKVWTCIGPEQVAKFPGWYTFRLNQKLNRLKPHAVIHADGWLLPGCRFRQYVAFPFADAAMLDQLSTSYRKLIRKKLPQIIRKSEGIISFRHDTAACLQTMTELPQNNIHVLPWPGLSQHDNVASLNKEQIREVHTEGKEYFVCSDGSGGRFNLINLLKAFSLFKARQKSNMLLVLLPDQPDEELDRIVEHYKFKTELRIIAGADALTRRAILHASYAWVSAARARCSLHEIICAVQLGVPVLHADLPGMTATFPDALLTINPEEPQDIAAKMMLVYKDENYRNALIKAGLEASLRYNPPATANGLYRLLQADSGPNHPQ